MVKNTQSVAGSEVITLKRGFAGGESPVYSLRITGAGAVTYKGELFVKEKGTRRSNIPPEKVKLLIDRFHKIDFFNLVIFSSQQYNDVPVITISFSTGGKKTNLSHFSHFATPKGLLRLEDLIDKTVESDKWIIGK